MAFRFAGLCRRQMAAGAGRALLGSRTQLRGYCQETSSTKTSSTSKGGFGPYVWAFNLGGLVTTFTYLYWIRNQALKIHESRRRRRKEALPVLQR